MKDDEHIRGTQQKESGPQFDVQRRPSKCVSQTSRSDPWHATWRCLFIGASQLHVALAAAQLRTPVTYGVTDESVVRLDAETGESVQQFSVGRLVGRPGIFADAKTVFVVRDAQSIVAVDLASGNARTFLVECCLTGSGSVVGDSLYLMSGERDHFVVTAYDRSTLRAKTQFELPSSVNAIEVVPSSPTPSTCVGDVNEDGKVTVDEITRAVNSALVGCD